MATYLENLCCRLHTCVTLRPEFEVACLEPLVLQIKQGYRADAFVQEVERNNAGLRHAAYRQFTVWRHGRLGSDVRRVNFPQCYGHLHWLPSESTRLKFLHVCLSTNAYDDVLRAEPWPAVYWCQYSFDATWLTWHHTLTSQNGLFILHPPLHYL